MRGYHFSSGACAESSRCAKAENDATESHDSQQRGKCENKRENIFGALSCIAMTLFLYCVRAELATTSSKGLVDDTMLGHDTVYDDFHAIVGLLVSFMAAA